MRNDFSLLKKTISEIIEEMTLSDTNVKEYSLIGGRTDSNDNVVQSLVKINVEIKDIYKYKGK